MKSGEGFKTSQTPVQAQGSKEEFEELDEEDEEEEGEVRIISPPRLTYTQGPSMQETSFLGVMDDDVDSFSAFFTPPIFALEVNTSATSILIAK